MRPLHLTRHDRSSTTRALQDRLLCMPVSYAASVERTGSALVQRNSSRGWWMPKIRRGRTYRTSLVIFSRYDHRARVCSHAASTTRSQDACTERSRQDHEDIDGSGVRILLSMLSRLTTGRCTVVVENFQGAYHRSQAAEQFISDHALCRCLVCI